MKYGHLLLALVFCLFAYWQLNDPDWPQWVAMYGYIALIAGWSAWTRPPQWLPWLGLAVATIWLLTLIPDFIGWLQMGAPTITGQMKAESPHVELTREFLGLAICLAALGYYVRLGRKRIAT